ncbi:MAG TPA: RodZ domain-containing protein [Streptosporangiaceae bacterium]|nr:RodZ domain-containing protein [Streptosporangiaceae bacterium]
MTIGDALAEARRQAGLTITQVSQRTCIRETIIRGIERDDFSACGGDFYARGHIRSIARAEGLEPEPLIREYDATQGAPEGITAADVFEPSTPIKLRERRRPNWSLAMLVALAAIVGIATYHFLSAPAKTSPVSSGRAPVVSHAQHKAAGHKKKSADTQTAQAHAHAHAHPIVIALSAVSNDCWVELTTAANQILFEGIIPMGTSKTWTEHKTVSMILGDPGAVTLTVNGKDQSPPPGQPVTLTLKSSQQAAG